MANRLESIWDALRNSMNPEEEQATTIGNSYSQGHGYNYPVPNEWGNSNQTTATPNSRLSQIPESARQSIDLGRPPIVNNDMLPTKGSMDAMDMMAMSPQNMASGASDAAWNSQADQRTPVEEPNFLEKAGSGIKDYFGSEENMANLAIGLNSMRLNPDANLAALMGKKLERLEKTKGNNKTAEQLRKMGRSDLAEAVESGSMDGKTAWSLAHKAPSAFQEKLDFIEGKTPEEIQSYKDAGVLGGGGTTINMGNEKYYDAIGKDIATMQSTHRERGELARSSLNALNELNTAINSFGETGPDADTKQKIRVMASKYGMESLIDENKMSNGQYVEAIKNRMVAEELRRNKGPQTDFDAKFAGTYIPGLGTSTEANKALMNYSKSISLQQTIFSNMSANIRVSDFENAQNTIQKIDQLALMSPGAMERNDGTWITFNEFFNSDLEDIKNMSAEERLTTWSDRYKKRMGFK